MESQGLLPEERTEDRGQMTEDGGRRTDDTEMCEFFRLPGDRGKRKSSVLPSVETKSAVFFGDVLYIYTSSFSVLKTL